MQFSTPVGIAVDSAGAVYVADDGNSRISKFTVVNGTATLAATWATPPCHALAIDTNGLVYAIATTSSKVMVYKRR